MISSIGRVNDVTITVAVGVMTAVASGWLVFFLNGRLQARADFRQLKDKIDNVAGRGATVLLEGRKYQIESFDRRGMVLVSGKQRVFLPVQRVAQAEFVVPTPEYDRVIEKEEREAHEKSMSRVREMIDEMIDEMLPRMMAKMKDEILVDGGELHAVIGMRITKALAEDGYRIEKANATSHPSTTREPVPEAKPDPRTRRSGTGIQNPKD